MAVGDDDASLNLNVKYDDVTGAGRALEDFQRRSRDAGQGARSYQSDMTAMTASMARMIETQQKTNALLLESVRTQQQSTRALDDSVTSMSRMVTITSLMNTAWDMFGKSSSNAFASAARGMSDMQTQAQQLHTTLGALTQRLEQIQASQSGIIASSTRLGQAVFDQSGAGAFARGLGIDPFSSARNTQQLVQSMREEMQRMLMAESLRTNITPTALLGGTQAAGRLGFDDQAAGAALTSMQRALSGVTLEAARARQTMVALGVDTSNAARALQTTMEALSRLPAGQERNLLLQQLVPGADPAQLSRASINRSQPQGSYGRYLRGQQDLSNTYTSAEAASNQRIEEMLSDPNARNFFGMGTANNRGGMISRYVQNVGQYFDENSPFSAARGALRRNARENLLNIWQGNFGEGFGGLGSTLTGSLQTMFNPVLGGALGYPNVPGPSPAQGTMSDELRRRAYLPQIMEYEQAQGRMSRASMNQRLDTERLRGQGLVGAGVLSQTDFDRDMGNQRERLRRMAMPVEYQMEEIQNLDIPAAGMSPANSRRFRTQYELSRAARRSGEDVSSDQIGNLLDQEQAEKAKRGIEDFVQGLQHSAEMLNTPLGQEAFAKAQFSARQAAFPGYSISELPGLSSAQSSRVNAGVTEQQTAAGGRLMRETSEQIQFTNQLTEAWKSGSGAVAALTAAHRAHQEALKGEISTTQEAARASQLFTSSIVSMQAQLSQRVNEAQFAATQAGGQAGAAAASGATGLRRQQIIDQVKAANREQRNAIVMSGASDDPSDVVARDRRLAEFDAQEQRLIDAKVKEAEGQAAAGRNVYDYNTRRLQGDLGLGAGGRLSVAPRADLSRGAAPKIGQGLDYASGLLPPGYSIQINGGGATSGHVKHSAHYDYDAVDYQINGPGGKVPNKGADTTGLYGTTYNNVLAWAKENDPRLAAHLEFGGNFGTHGSKGQGPDDLMHIGARGYSTGAAASRGAGSAAADSAAADLIRARQRRQAQTELEGTGVSQPTAAQVEERRQGIAIREYAQQREATQLRLKDTEAALALEKQMPDAIGKGAAAEHDLASQIQIEHQFRKAIADAQATGNSEAVKQLETDKERTLELERQKNSIETQNVIAREKKSFDQSQGATAREISALQNGGTSAYDLSVRSEGISSRLISQGVPEDQARQIADEQAKAAQSADDYKKAILDASNELKTNTKQAIESLTTGLLTSVGHGRKLKDALRDAALGISNIGVKSFVTKPLETLADNVISGRGFNFNVGTSGKDTSDVFKASLGGIGKSLGIGGDSSSGGGWFSRLFGGGSSGSGSGSGGGSAYVPTAADFDQADEGIASYAIGGYIPSDQLAFLHSGEIVIPAQTVDRLQQMVGGPVDMLSGKVDALFGAEMRNLKDPFTGSIGGSGNFFQNLLNNGGGQPIPLVNGPLGQQQSSLFGPDAGGYGGDFGGFGDFGYGGGGVAEMHGGGMVGFGGRARFASPYMFAGAPRFHGGGLMPGEYPIVAKRGERVLSPAETKAYNANQGGRGPITIHQHISTPDANSFRATQRQTAGVAASATDRAFRNM